MCLSGDPSFLDITWPSFITNVLSPNPTAHVYVSSVCNSNCHKLALLSSGLGAGRLGDGLGNVGKGFFWRPDIKGVNVITALPEEVVDLFKATRVVVQGGPPDTQLPVMEYYLRDRCLHMIEREEGEKGWKYKWILYAGLEQVWFGPPPSLQGLTVETTLVVPTPSNYEESGGGYFEAGLGLRQVAALALSRSSVFYALVGAGFEEDLIPGPYWTM